MKLRLIVFLILSPLLFSGFIRANHTQQTDEYLEHVELFVKFYMNIYDDDGITVIEKPGFFSKRGRKAIYRKIRSKFANGRSSRYLGQVEYLDGRLDVLAHEIAHIYGADEKKSRWVERTFKPKALLKWRDYFRLYQSVSRLNYSQETTLAQSVIQSETVIQEQQSLPAFQYFPSLRI